ncbi:MAG: DUF2167 domain-containing protein [Janthinobacterium lividum]
MNKPVSSLLFLFLTAAPALAAPRPPALPDSATRHQFVVDSINGSFRYQQGHVVLPGGTGELTVPRGFRYLDSAQSNRVLHQLWHNPAHTNLGMLFPASRGPVSNGSWGYVIEYDAMGYVKDDDADDIKYDELLETMQKETEEENADRTAAGYGAIHLVGWGAKPYYDKQQHTLHWAKLLRFGSGIDQTLNYNVRILGRKGVLVFNAVAEPAQLADIQTSIPDLLANVTFAKGQQYSDYSAGIDEVAAYTIGGLVAGKVLAKVGLFAIMLKFWKLGLLAVGGAWAAIKRLLGLGAREEEG